MDSRLVAEHPDLIVRRRIGSARSCSPGDPSHRRALKAVNKSTGIFLGSCGWTCVRQAMLAGSPGRALPIPIFSAVRGQTQGQWGCKVAPDGRLRPDTCGFTESGSMNSISCAPVKWATPNSQVDTRRNKALSNPWACWLRTATNDAPIPDESREERQIAAHIKFVGGNQVEILVSRAGSQLGAG
jgi:hypothetical protein